VLTVLPEQRVEDTLALMTRPRDARLTPDLADEVCARNNGQAVVSGSVAAMGSKYLLTLTATDCAGDRTLAAEKVQVDAREALVPALDGLTGRMRGKLGESSPSVARFDVPLAQERTVSLEALKAYSEAKYLYNHGKRPESIPLFQHAIELDPDFAEAYADLSTVYKTQHEDSLGIAAISKAYALRDKVSERDRFYIVARYHDSVTKDVLEAIRNYQAWTETYPLDPRPWGNLASIESRLGRYAQAIDDAKRGLELGRDLEPSYAILADAYMRDGQLDKAQAVCNQAIAAGLGGEDTHDHLLEIAYAKGDRAMVQSQIDWAKGKPAERYMTLMAAEIAYSQGRVQAADALADQASGFGGPLGLRDFYAAGQARYMVEFGRTDRARGFLDESGDGAGSHDYLFTLAEIGDPARVETILKDNLAKGAADTLLNAIYAPQVRAALALRRGKPDEAVAALQPALRYNLPGFEVQYMRGSAYLAAGDGAGAATQFRWILDHQGVYPVSPLYPLARLGLARAYRLERDLADSRRAYQGFLAAWKDADPDVPILKAAKAEYARL
jgi:tetratricopeptide (TPR) repeat protein